MNYDTDKKVPTYGFGGEPRFPQGLNGPTSHFFPCSGDWNNNEGFQVDGIFNLYNFAINHVRLSGPTYFAPLLQQVCNFTRSAFQSDPNNYTV